MKVRRDLLMPKLGLTMTEGSISEWSVAPGDVYNKGDCLFVVETEKITNEVVAEHDGTLVEIVTPAGETVPVGGVVAYIEDDLAEVSGSVRESGRSEHTLDSKSEPERQVAEPGRSQHNFDNQRKGGRIIATPLAKRLAKQRNIDLAGVAGTGPGGRIVARDVDGDTCASGQAATQVDGKDQQGTELQSHLQAEQSYTVLKPTAIQATTAARLTQGAQEAPHFYLFLEAEVSRLLTLRKELNTSRAEQNKTPFTLNHFIVKAVAAALRRQPEANQVWSDEGIKRYSQLSVGIAVDTASGLVAPTVADVGSCSMAELAQRVDDVIARARDSRLVLSDMAPAAITVSNAGMHNVTYMGSIINPGQAMILGVGSVKGVFRPDDSGKPALRQEMGLVLSADHRVTDGVRALAFLNSVVRLLEQPLMLLTD